MVLVTTADGDSTINMGNPSHLTTLLSNPVGVHCAEDLLYNV